MPPLDSSYDYSSAITAISKLLAPTEPFQEFPVHVELKPGIIGIHSSEFGNLEDFKASYLACQGPVLCFLQPNEVPAAIQWLRDSDDIALEGEPRALTDWRLNRIASLFDRRLDPLTKVFCREELISALKSVCDRASPFHPTSLILSDIDRFKEFNDRFGVGAGNRLLERLGNLIQTACQHMLVARTRGGEFGVLVEAGGDVAKKIALVIQNTIQETGADEIDQVTSSFGVATAFAPCEPALLLTQADEALFAAKANGRNQVVCYSEIAEISKMDSDQLAVISLENKARVLSERVTNFVTQQSKRIMRTLHREANTDALTQLFNRRYLDRQLIEEFNLAVTNHTELCLAMVDLDHFGQINKTHGWPTGDKALREVAETITQAIRGTDWVGRYGGEEICIVMPATIMENAVVVCERIRSSIEATEYQTTSGEPIKITVSVGVVQLDFNLDESVMQMIERVSQLTLTAKTSGRNRVHAVQ